MLKFAWALILVTSVANAQEDAKPLPDIEASLAMEKQQYLAGEPIMLIFKARYTGDAILVDLSESDPYGPCSHFQISVLPDAKSREPKSGPPCEALVWPMFVSCLTGGIGLPPGEEVQRHIVLNHFHDFTQPGFYTVKAKRYLSCARNWGKQNQPTGWVAGTFTFTVVAPNSPDDVRESFAPYVAALSSGSFWQKQEAAEAISSVAAPFLEPYLLQMLSIPTFEYTAIQGLRRLNSATGRVALFELLTRDQSFRAKQEFALRALRDSGDASYGPKLLGLMDTRKDEHERAELLEVAARLDPKSVDAIVRQLLKSPQAANRESGATALAATEQPTALPILVSMLGDPSPEVRRTAAQGLVSLTRARPPSALENSMAPTLADVRFWTAWLRANPQLPIHLRRECPQATEW